MKYQAAIFDMDGLLLDTERVCMSIFKQTCDTLNVPFLDDVYPSIIGRNSAGIEQTLRAAYDPYIEYGKLHGEWKKRYDDIVLHQAVPVKEGVVDLLEWFQSQGVKLAVATSTGRAVAQIKLRLAGLDAYFDSVTTGCEVKNGKPDPEIYLLAANRIAVDPRHCLAFEDSNNGVRSAVGANMNTFQIPDLVQPCSEVTAMGHHIMPSLSDVLAYLKTLSR
ncbi:HAD family phosphatase [Vibrio sp. S9_S30]|uniref:HAD family hydrolase n=1 Tax=Vibrio sp. S9_S30 TaxID=2720226 RepID=UPI0016801584|nr:HAD family phosphatase [Vibrio sp. S9_S30]MBD1557648.1 HAD family phosphatase [Vibrio sp. S9_S30]